MRSLFAAVALVIAASGAALLSAWWNRTGEYREVQLANKDVWVRGSTRDRSAVFLYVNFPYALEPMADGPSEHRRLPRMMYSAFAFDGVRLLLVNASRSREELEQRYTDRRRYLIVRRGVQPIAVPAHLRQIALEREPPGPDRIEKTRWKYRIRFGRNLEPWLVGIEKSQ